MKLPTQTTTAELTAETIDDFSAKIREHLTTAGLPKRDVTRFALTAEEIMLRSSGERENGTYGTQVRLTTGARFLRPFFSLEIDGGANNVFAHSLGEQSLLGDRILKNLGLSPEYVFANDLNTYTFRIRRKALNPFVTLLLALAAAALIGGLGLLLPAGTREMLQSGVLTPLHDTFLNVLGCIAGPMVFLSVAWGIYGIGDAATFKRIGKRMLLGYIGIVFLAVVLFGWVCAPFFELEKSGGGGSGSGFSAIFEMLLGVIPKNIFSPFVEGNTLQIIFLAVVIGVAMLFLGRKTNAVATAVEQINYIVQFLIEFINRLVPYFIVIVLVEIVWSDTASTLLGVGKLFAVFIASCLVLMLLTVAYISLRFRVPFVLLIKKGIPTLLIALTTASSAAAFGTNMKACRNDFGIDDTIASFGIPLGMVTFKPATAFCFMATALFFAETYGVRADASWFALMLFTVAILAIATQPIPGGAMTAYTMLFAQLGIPAGALAVALACDTLFDFISTGTDQFLLPYVLLGQAGRLGMVDEKILKKQKSAGNSGK